MSEGAAVVEIALAERPARDGRAEDPAARVRSAVRGAQGEVAAAEETVGRASGADRRGARAVSVRPGQRVTAGQPLATVSATAR